MPEEPRKKGKSLGVFLVTAYNVAREDDYGSADEVTAKGLARKYAKGFLRGVLMQGSGVDRQARYIQIDWSKGKPSTVAKTSFHYVTEIKTGSGRTIAAERSIAVDPSEIALGKWVYIDTVGWRRADDTGGMIVGKHIDRFMLVSRAEALGWGKKHLEVWAEG
jgi:3D (Asp-Asp-Asp) domain-containing protein